MIYRLEARIGARADQVTVSASASGPIDGDVAVLINGAAFDGPGQHAATELANALQAIAERVRRTGWPPA